MIYEIRLIEPRTYPDGTLAGGDDHWDAERKSKQAAFNYAKRLSLKPDVYEAVVYEYEGKDDRDYIGEFTGQWYFEKGKMTFDMGGNN